MLFHMLAQHHAQEHGYGASMTVWHMAIQPISLGHHFQATKGHTMCLPVAGDFQGAMPMLGKARSQPVRSKAIMKIAPYVVPGSKIQQHP